jgi:hypothetical protein
MDFRNGAMLRAPMDKLNIATVFASTVRIFDPRELVVKPVAIDDLDPQIEPRSLKPELSRQSGQQGLLMEVADELAWISRPLRDQGPRDIRERTADWADEVERTRRQLHSPSRGVRRADRGAGGAIN